MKKALHITPIMDGTVIDHIPPGMALKVLSILGITGNEGYTVSVAMNVCSKKFEKKDIVKVEKRELNPAEVNKIALIAQNATINIIKNYEVIKKYKVKVPERVVGIVKCANPSCITNSGEPVTPEFIVVARTPLRLKCIYCCREMSEVKDYIV